MGLDWWPRLRSPRPVTADPEQVVHGGQRAKTGDDGCEGSSANEGLQQGGAGLPRRGSVTLASM